MTALAGPEGRDGARALAVRNAWKAQVEPGGKLVLRTARGQEVHIGRLGRSGNAVEVWLAGDAEGSYQETYERPPDYRIENPPTLVEHGAGDLEIRGRRFRADPLQALAEVIATLGGARGQRGRRR